MAVEMPHHQAIEVLRSERKLQCVAPNKCAARHSLASHREHGRALIQANDVSAQAGREEAGTAGNIENSTKGQRRESRFQGCKLFRPARANALFEQPRAQVPIVVFRGSPIVINTLGLRHLFYFSRGSFRSDREIERRALIGLGVGPYPATVPPQHLLCRGKADARSRKLGVLM